MREQQVSIVHKEPQASLFEFLRLNLEVGFTFIETAKIEALSDPEQSATALAKSRKTLYAVRQSAGCIEDADMEAEIYAMADRLETALVGFDKNEPVHRAARQPLWS